MLSNITDARDSLEADRATPRKGKAANRLDEKAVLADRVESGAQGDTALKPVITQEHHDYLMNRHGTTDLKPVPTMDDLYPYNWPSWKVRSQRNRPTLSADE